VTAESTGAAVPTQRLKVLSIVGPGRSGTTVLACILGEVHGTVNVGELRWLWRRGVIEQRPCGCGRPLDRCPLWAPVLQRTLPRNGASPADTVAAQDEVAGRRRRLRAVRSARGTRSRWPALEQVRHSADTLVHAVADATGARVIVDSSKRPQDAAVLAAVGGVDHYVLNMVRDPGAVAWSWQRRNKSIRTAEGQRPMLTRGLLSSALRWVENCLGAEALRRYVPAERWMFLRYEDFAAQPRAAVERILAFLGEDGGLPFRSEDTVELSVNHTVAGNPDRFTVGRVRITVDDEWRHGMPLRRRVAVRALTWPLLLRYGYPLAGRLRRRPPGERRVSARQPPPPERRSA
jgi:Sulfotransferase family